MAIESVNASFYADPAGLAALKRDAAAQTPEALRETARQFETSRRILAARHDDRDR